MRATSVGHAGILVETDAGSILCDPWFVPAFFGSWFVFPRNDRLDDDLLERIEHADFLYISHLHGDHHDETWLRDHLRRDIPILLPGFPTREQQRTLQALGFTEFIRTVDTEELEIAPGLTVAIHVETSITDGPGGDSALVVSDGTSILVNQNDCRTNDLGQLRSHGPVDLHWLQFSGAIWYPMVYEMPEADKRRLCEAKVNAQFARAMRYVENIDARYVVPSAGPPAFLDDDLFALNMIDGNELSIFPDQTAFLRRLDAVGHSGVMNVPGTTIDIGPDDITVTHPMPTADVEAIFTDKRTYLEAYRADWKPWLDDLKASWNPPSTDLLATLREWWEPLLEMAPTLRTQVGANVLINAGDLAILVDFPNGQVRLHDGEDFAFRFDIPRPLVETVVASRAVDWSNSLLLSCRFTAWRAGEFNEYVYNFLKSLSRERMRRTEAEVVRKLTPADVLESLHEPDIRIGDYIVQRRCPHRNADLAAFGEIDGCDLVCTLHGHRFDLETGRNKTAADQPLRIRPATDTHLTGYRHRRRRRRRRLREDSDGADHPQRHANELGGGNTVCGRVRAGRTIHNLTQTNWVAAPPFAGGFGRGGPSTTSRKRTGRRHHRLREGSDGADHPQPHANEVGGGTTVCGRVRTGWAIQNVTQTRWVGSTTVCGRVRTGWAIRNVTQTRWVGGSGGASDV